MARYGKHELIIEEGRDFKLIGLINPQTKTLVFRGKAYPNYIEQNISNGKKVNRNIMDNELLSSLLTKRWFKLVELLIKHGK